MLVYISEMFGAYVSKFSRECDRIDLSEELKLANSNITTALSKLMDSTAKVLIFFSFFFLIYKIYLLLLNLMI